MSREYFTFLRKNFEEQNMGIVDRIRTLCEERGITINKLEKETGIGRGNVARWDAHQPGSDRVQKVADYFGVTSEYLLTGENKKRPVSELTGLDAIIFEINELLPQVDQEQARSVLEHVKGLVSLRQSQDVPEQK